MGSRKGAGHKERGACAMTDDDHTPTVIDAWLAGPQHALERVPTRGAARVGRRAYGWRRRVPLPGCARRRGVLAAPGWRCTKAPTFLEARTSDNSLSLGLLPRQSGEDSSFRHGSMLSSTSPKHWDRLRWVHAFRDRLRWVYG